MTPDQFVVKWKASARSERAAAQEQFIDICHMLGEGTPGDDPTGERFAFEKGANKTTGADGWADIWKAGHFAWEYKGKGKDLKAAFAQLQQYAGALGNPPLLVVSDMEVFRIHTAWTNTVSRVHELSLDDLLDPKKREILKWVLSDPERLRPGLTRQSLTEQAAEKFAGLARALRSQDHAPEKVAHFINRLVFCMFAEDVDLLPNKMFQRMLEASQHRPEQFEQHARSLFGAMKAGGMVGFEEVEWFNGGLFDDDSALQLGKDEIKLVLTAARLDWAEIDPSIFGTLFERGLDPDKRSQLGAHYTDRDKIMQIVDPVVVRPLGEEWDVAKGQIQGLLAKASGAKSPSARTKTRNEAEARYRQFLDRLRAFRVLDPACGSGNFLYLALLALKDLEHRAGVEAEAFGLHREFPQIGPECVAGIEVNPYAAELARISVWIGEIQWMRRNGFGVRRNPILRPLGTIECRDAVLNPNGTAATWPEADVVIGNPPFLGNKKMIGELGEQYTTALRKAWPLVPGGADLVCYWFAAAWERIISGTLTRAGLVSTNSIRGGANREVLKPIVEHGRIFNAWSDEEWTVDGAAVRVSLVCFDLQQEVSALLDGETVTKIYSDLSGKGRSVDLTKSERLTENANASFIGVFMNGQFEIPGALAREWLRLPRNVNGKPNSDVLRRTLNGADLLRGRSDKWVIDFGAEMPEDQAALYEAPFEYALAHVKPFRQRLNDDGSYAVRRVNHREIWWRYAEARPGMRKALAGLSRFIVTPMVSSTRVFVFLEAAYLPNQKLVVIPRDDDTCLGILSSRFHECWTLSMCTWIGTGNDVTYSPTMTFETFPFPEGMTPDLASSSYADDPRAKRIANAARHLDTLRRNWLNPPDLVQVAPEIAGGFPDRLLPNDDQAAAILAKRTLTALYNERPRWLANAHTELDAAVAAAYGWPSTIIEEEALANLLALNLTRARATK